MIMTTEQNKAAGEALLQGAFIVTGAASGLGLEIAKAIEAVGGTPICFDVHAAPERFEQDRVDVSDAAAVEDSVRRRAQQFGGLSGVIANAGVDACGGFLDVTAQAWERVVRVNLLGTAAVVRAALPYLIESRGRVVTVASTLGLRAVGDATAYCASKFGIVGFTRALSTEFAGRVGVTLLIPGGMRTHFFDERDEKYKPAPDAPLNQPADVARSVVFALSQPPGCDVKELLITPSVETSWP